MAGLHNNNSQSYNTFSQSQHSNKTKSISIDNTVMCNVITFPCNVFMIDCPMIDCCRPVCMTSQQLTMLLIHNKKLLDDWIFRNGRVFHSEVLTSSSILKFKDLRECPFLKIRYHGQLRIITYSAHYKQSHIPDPFEGLVPLNISLYRSV